MRSTLLALCALVTVALIYEVICVFGVVTKPFFGYWDAVVVASGQPFIAEIAQSTPDGASARAGLRDGDTVDLRDVSSYERVALLFQPDLRADDSAGASEGRAASRPFHWQYSLRR